MFVHEKVVSLSQSICMHLCLQAGDLLGQALSFRQVPDLEELVSDPVAALRALSASADADVEQARSSPVHRCIYAPCH